MSNAKASEIGVAQRLRRAVTSAPSLAQSLPIGFSLAALHTPVETLERLAARHCDDLVGLKAHQKQLYQQRQYLRQTAVPLSQATHAETLHGRQTQRTVEVDAAPSV